MNTKVTGKSNNVLAYFGSLIAIVAFVSLILFILQLVASSGGAESPLFSREMLYLQLSILGILIPSTAFCSYFSLRLKLNSRFYKNALTFSAIVILPIFPLVSPLGIFLLWLSLRPK